MSYESAGIIAAVILAIINHDVLFGRKNDRFFAVGPIYRRFLASIFAFYATDVLWGVFDRLKWTRLLYADTILYYIAMALTIFSWTQYVIAYLNKKTVLSKLLKYTGLLFLFAEVVFIVVNFFKPILFSYNDKGEYVPGPVRYVNLAAQIALFLIMSIHTLAAATRVKGSEKGRHRTIGMFGITMTLMISIQIFKPLLPLYTIGYMLGTCLLYAFVIQDERTEYRHELEKALRREREQKKELGSTKKLAYTDPLTGIGNKLAYAEAEERLQLRINAGESLCFAIAVFDLNDLKRINDTMGHEAGDKYLVDACRMICGCFTHSRVFRIGGDEFSAILENRDFENRYELLRRFDREVEENLRYGGVVVAAAMAHYDPEIDDDCMTIFKRADRKMYERKRELKETGAKLQE